MPREFQDFSKEVSQGTDKIVKGLEDVRNAADDADIASGKLSATQNRGVRSGNSYAKSMAGISKELSSVASMSQSVSKGLSSTDSSARSLSSSLSSIRMSAGDAASGLSEVRDVSQEVASSLEKISGKKISPNFDAKAAKAARKAIEDISDAYEEVSSIPPPKPPKIPTDKLESNFKEITKDIKNLQNELVKLEADVDFLDDVKRETFVNLNIDLSAAKEFEDFVGGLDKSQQAFYTTIAATEGLDTAIEMLSKQYDVFNAKIRIAARESEEAARASKTYAKEVAEVIGLQKNLNEKLEDGASEAKSFAGGLGVGNGMAIAAGIAVFFLATKVADLIDDWKDAAVELATFNTELAALESRAQALGFEGSFDSLRNELSLTRAQSEKFFMVLEDGVTSGAASIEVLQKAAKQLTATFGGDQTARLEEYVNLLKDIPTLDTDLAITASLDDQAASVFALARAGKFSAVIDLQAAGLAGGIKIDALSADDKELIDAAHHTEKTMEDIQDTMLGFFPSWGPQFAATVGGIARVAALLGGLVAGVGLLNALGSSQIIAQGTTTAAVLATGGIDAASDIGKSISKTATPGIMQGLKSLLPKILGGGATVAATAGAGGAGGGVAAGATALASNPVGWAIAVGIAVVAISAGMVWAGDKLSDFGDDMISDGNKISGGFAKIYGASLKASAGLLLLGPIGGVVAALVFALPDFLDGIEAVGQGLQEQVGGINKYNSVLSGAGSFIEAGAKSVRDGFDFVKDGIIDFAKEIPGTINELSKMASEITGGLIPSFEDIKKSAKGLVFSKEYLKEQERLAPRLANINDRLEQVAKTSERYDKALQGVQKGQQISGLALQKQLNETKNALESGKIEILDFRDAVKNLQLDNLIELGGSAAGFDNALKQASNSVTNRFEKVSDVLVKRRSDILKDSKLNATARRDALLDLKNKELEATRIFVDGMTKVIGALLKTPQIIQAGLEGAFSKAKFDFKVEEGVGDFGADFQNQIEQFSNQLTGAVSGWEKTTVKLEAAEKKFNETRAKGLATLTDDIGGLSAGGQAELKGVDFKDQKAVRAKFDEIQKEFQDTENKIDEITKNLSTKSFTALSNQLQKSSTDLNTWGKATQAAQEEFKDLSKDLAKDPSDLELAQEVKDAKEKLDENMKLLREAEKSQAEALDGLYENFGKELVKSSGKSAKEVKSALRQVADGLSEGLETDDIMKNADDGALTLEALELINKNESAKEKLIKSGLKTLQKQNDAQVEALGILEPFVAGENIVTKLLETRNASFEELLSIANQSKDIAEGFVKATEAVTKTEQRELDIIKSRQSLALLLNSTTENLLSEQQKQNQISQKTIAEADKQIANARFLRDKLNEQAKSAKNSDTKAVFEKAAKEQDNAIVRLNQSRGEAITSLGRAGDLIGEAIERFNDSISGRQIQQEFDLSDAMAEVAAFQDDFVGAIEASTDMAIASANKRASAERRILAESLEQEKKNIEARASAAGTPQEKSRIMQEGKILLEAKKRTEEAKIELRQKQRVVEAAQREASLKLEGISLDEDLINAQMDFLSDVGGSFSSVLKLQQAGVQLERDKLRVLQEELETTKEAGIEGLELRKKEHAVQIQGLKLRRAEFGIQRDIFENLIGKAFGEMRADIGAARRRGSDVGIMGRERTRVMARSGLFQRAGEDGTKTIDERRADRVLGGLAGLGGELKARGQGVDGEGPKRLKIEEQIAKSGETTAKATSGLAKAALERGSLFVHDVTTEAILRIIAGNTDAIASGTSDVKAAVENNGNKTEAGVVAQMKDSGTAREQLELARKSFKEQVSIARNIGDKEQAEKAFATAREEANKIGELEETIRSSENFNPLAGNVNFSDPDFQRIMSGKPSQEELEFQKMADERQKTIAEEVKKGRDADKANIDDITKKTPAEAQAAKAPSTNVSVVPETTDQLSSKSQQREERASVEDVKGMGAAGTQEVKESGGGSSVGGMVTSITVQGQINIMMDTKLFRAEMATLVAEAISTPEVRTAIGKQGFISTQK